MNKFRKIRGVDFRETGAFQDFPIDYTRTALGALEFKTLFYNSGSVALDNIRSIGEFAQKNPPAFSQFHTSITDNMLLVSFVSDEKLKNTPVVQLNGKDLSFVS